LHIDSNFYTVILNILTVLKFVNIRLSIVYNFENNYLRLQILFENEEDHLWGICFMLCHDTGSGSHTVPGITV